MRMILPVSVRRAIHRRYWSARLRPGYRGTMRRTVTQRQLALQFGVSQPTIHRIISEVL